MKEVYCGQLGFAVDSPALCNGITPIRTAW